MISLYIHIPFCASKCAYCSFNSTPTDSSDIIIDSYIEALKKEINYYSETLTDKTIKTLYFGGGTPSRIGVTRIIDIIEYIAHKFDLEDLAELSIELNPYPEQEILAFVNILNKKYPKISRLRYSFGIQSFDDEVLKLTGRAYSFGSIVEFLRALVHLKQDNNVFNFDFIAFGKFQINKNGFKQLRHEFKREFLHKFLNSGYVDSISLYTIEGIKDQEVGTRNEVKGKINEAKRTSNMTQVSSPTSQKWFGSDEEIMEEFLILKGMIEDAGFGRYEISNFAQASKASIHNMVYRSMEPYIGIGISAASFINGQGLMTNDKLLQQFKNPIPSGIRWTNTSDIKKYIEGIRIDESTVQTMNESDLLIEEFFLRLRTREGIANFSKFIPLLVPNHQGLLDIYKKEGLVNFDGNKLQLTDLGMNVYNTMITDLLQKI
ncbi:MAG TPA: radical SAM protein [Candidatus Absconditabacterales bacterium]|nr:radical SAM protein [Candidatus Absconditabacterales bacterium]